MSDDYNDPDGEDNGCCGCIVLMGGLIVVILLLGVLLRALRWAVGL